MRMLFSAKFTHQQVSEIFTIYQVSDNLYQAKSGSEVIMLWKTKEVWDGVTNLNDSRFIEYIGKAIDKHFSISNLS